MTEQKQLYLMDALNEMEDSFIAEAIEYETYKTTWKYTKELSAIAACAAVLVISVGALQVLPIGKGAMESSSDEAKIECEFSAEAAPGSFEEKSDMTVEVTEEEKFVEGSSSNEADSVGNIQNESVKTENVAEWITLEQLLEKDVDIFMGTVKELQSINGFTIATFTIEDSIRSELQEGDSCHIYISRGETGNAATEDLERLKEGSRAILFPYKTSDRPGLYNEEYAEYYLSVMPILFAETEEGMIYKGEIYKETGEKGSALKEAAAYIRKLLEE